MDAYRLIGNDYHDSNLSSINEYLERGGDPNFQLYSGITVFIEAASCHRDNIEVVRQLLNAGADVNLSTHIGTTPLHLAVHHRKRLVVEELIQSGASVNAKDFLGRTVLHHAVGKYGICMPTRMMRFDPDIWIVKELLKHEDIDCNQVDFNGETPLMVAVKNHAIQITRMLVRSKANPNIGNDFSETPLHVAFSLPANDVEIELLLGGASIHSLDHKGRTPLDVLIDNGLKHRGNVLLNAISKVIAFKYSITSDLKRKFELIPGLSQVFNQCCKEADYMRRDFIYGNITIDDFLYECFVERDSGILLHQIYKPLVERLVTNIYPVYRIEFVEKIPRSSLCKVLQLIAENNCRIRDLSYLLSISNINSMITKQLRHDQVFDLIRAFF